MIPKSTLRTTVKEVLEDHEIENPDFASDLIERLVQDFSEEVFDDEEEEDEESGRVEDEA